MFVCSVLLIKTAGFSLIGQVKPADSENFGRMVELWFIFSLIWSVCASVDEEGRKKIDTFLREIEGTFPNKVNSDLKS